MNILIAERMLILAGGAAADLIFGDPHRLYHPVQAIGKLISSLEHFLRKRMRLSDEPEKDAGRKRLAGAVLALLVMLISTAVPCLLLAAARMVHEAVYLALSILFTWQLLAMKSLKTESMKVYRELEKGDLSASRKAVSMIVGRDTEHLTAEGVTKAAVETVAENASDGVIAPLLYLFLFGVPGGFFYKSVNTMDSMIGYKNDRYRYFGTFAARTDDVLNYIPSRLSALFMIAAARITGLDGKNALRIWKRDRRKHASPNSAQTESVCAGALDVELAGDATYFGVVHHKPTLGDPVRPVEVEDIPRANRLLYATGGLVFGAGMAVLAAVGCLI